MAFDKTWDEAAPGGTDNVSSGDDEIRDTRYGIRERLAVDHNAYATEAGESNLYTHKKISLTKLAADPGASATLGFLYVKDIGAGVYELFYEDAAGNVLQMTDAGSLVGTTAFRTGDWIVSETTAARAGWTDVSATYEDKFIRISSGTPLDTGGANTHTHAAGSYSAGAHTHTMTVSTVSATITAGEGDANQATPSHTHTVTAGAGGGGAISGTSASANNIPAYVQIRIWRHN